MALTEDGYAVDMAEDGEEGLYKALNWDYDVILLDIMMPTARINTAAGNL